jgi:hypothetical protein
VLPGLAVFGGHPRESIRQQILFPEAGRFCGPPAQQGRHPQVEQGQLPVVPAFRNRLNRVALSSADTIRISGSSHFGGFTLANRSDVSKPRSRLSQLPKIDLAPAKSLLIVHGDIPASARRRWQRPALRRHQRRATDQK